MGPASPIPPMPRSAMSAEAGRKESSMSGLGGQQRRVLKHVQLPWDDGVKDPRQARGKRHGHLGLLGLVVAAFAVGKKGLKQAAHLAQGEVKGLQAVANDETGRELWSLGALRAVLTSVVAAPCLDMEFISAKEGESPAFRQLLPRVVQAYGEHFGVVTADAGLTAAPNGALVRQWGKHYCFGLKANQPSLYAYAVQALAAKQCPARARTEQRAHGKTVVRELWTHALAPGEVDFPGARMLLLVRQQHWGDDGSCEEEYRYFVTSLDTTLFNYKQLLRLVRVHWGIENRHHWTLDVVLGEDERQPCRPTRTALEVVAWLRALAFNLLSFFRTRLPPDGRHLVEWARACEVLRDSLVHGRRQQTLLPAA
jgi:predicted transposase YbfD/YdcC